MAISMMAGSRATWAPSFCTTTTPRLESLRTGDQFALGSSSRGLKSSSSRQYARRLGCPRRGVGLSNVRPSCTRVGGSILSASCRWSGAEEYRFFGPAQRSNCERSPNSSTTWRGLGFGNDSLASRSTAATSSASGFPEGEEDQQSDSGRASNFLQWIATLRVLPALVLGLGVVLSLRPGSALANEALSPQGKGLLASAWAGLVAGGLHTLTGPDHLAALAPLCIGRSRLQSAAVGALWGCGHDAGQIIFGLVFLVLKDKLHIELIRIWASRVVGLTLMTIGGVGIYESQVDVAVLAEEAGLQDGSGKQTVVVKNDSKHATTFATGVVYGLQPDALLMILPALALPSRATGAAFLGMFLLGTVLAMGSYTLFIASCSHALQRRIPGITKNLTLGSSVIAIALGLGLIASELFGLSFF